MRKSKIISQRKARLLEQELYRTHRAMEKVDFEYRNLKSVLERTEKDRDAYKAENAAMRGTRDMELAAIHQQNDRLIQIVRWLINPEVLKSAIDIDPQFNTRPL